MITSGQYTAWLADPARDHKRLFLVEPSYSDDNTQAGHGRDNFGATLNPVTSLTVSTYTNNQVDVEFMQPTDQEGYTWEIWRDGEFDSRTSLGSITFTAVVGQAYKFAVASSEGSRYSVPWVIEFTHQGNEEAFKGGPGDWRDIGFGKGGDGTGKLHFSWPEPWRSPEGQFYDDFITSELYLERGLDDFNSVGDFKAISLADDLDWEKLYWRGHKCLILHGDEDWPRDDFYQLSISLIEDVRRSDGQEYQFDLMDGGRVFKQKEFQAAGVISGSFRTTLGSIAKDNADVQMFAGSLAWLNTRGNYSSYYEIDDSDSMEDVIRAYAKSVNGSVGINDQEYVAYVFKSQKKSTRIITDDDVIDDSARMIESIQPVRRVTLNLANNLGSVSALTSAATGELIETLTVNTVLTVVDEANVVLQEYVDYYSVAHPVWELKVHDAASVLTLGDVMMFDTKDMKGDFLIKHESPKLLSNESRIEAVQVFDAQGVFTFNIEWVA